MTQTFVSDWPGLGPGSVTDQMQALGDVDIHAYFAESLKRIRENICKMPNIGPKTWEMLSFYCMYTDQKFLLKVIYFKIIYMYIYDFLVDYIGSLTSGIY